MHQGVLYRVSLVLLVFLCCCFGVVERTTVQASDVVVARHHRSRHHLHPRLSARTTTRRPAKLFTEPTRVTSSVAVASASHCLYLESSIESPNNPNPNVHIRTTPFECSGTAATSEKATLANIPPRSDEGKLEPASSELLLLESSSLTLLSNTGSAWPTTNTIHLVLASVVWFGWMMNLQGLSNLVGTVVATANAGWNSVPSASWASLCSAAATAATLWLSSSSSSSSSSTTTKMTATGLIQIGLQLLVQKFGHRLFDLIWTRFEAWLSEMTTSTSNRVMTLYHAHCTSSAQWWCTSLASMVWAMVKQTSRKFMVQTMVQQAHSLYTETLPAVLRWTRDAVQKQVQWITYTH